MKRAVLLLLSLPLALAAWLLAGRLIPRPDPPPQPVYPWQRDPSLPQQWQSERLQQLQTTRLELPPEPVPRQEAPPEMDLYTAYREICRKKIAAYRRLATANAWTANYYLALWTVRLREHETLHRTASGSSWTPPEKDREELRRLIDRALLLARTDEEARLSEKLEQRVFAEPRTQP